jgi:hypothetical protein
MATLRLYASLDQRRSTCTSKEEFVDVFIDEVSNDFLVDEAALADPENPFQFSPLWPQLDSELREAILTSIRSSRPQAADSYRSLSRP